MESQFLTRRMGAAALCFMLFSSAAICAAAEAVLSGPSNAVAGDLVMLHGKHFSAGASFTIETTIGNTRSQELVTADSDGSLSFQLVTASAGTYLLEVRDDNNRLLATSVVLVQPAGG